MPRNGSGTYSLPAGNPVVTGTTISSTVHNNTNNDIASELTNSVDKDGQTVLTGNLDHNGNRIIRDADGDTYDDHSTDDQIDKYIAGALDFQYLANILRALSGSVIETNTINETTADNGVVIDSVTLKDGYLSSSTLPTFLAVASAQANVTGNGTEYTVLWATEVFDQGADFASNTFTAPVTGRYFLSAQVRWDGVTAAADFAVLKLITSNRTYITSVKSTNNLKEINTLNLNLIADMDAADTATATLSVTGEASDVIDIQAANSTIFSGCLLA